MNKDFKLQQEQFLAQPLNVQQTVEALAGRLAEAIIESRPGMRFDLPEAVWVGTCLEPVPASYRKQEIGHFWERHPNLCAAVAQRLDRLEANAHHSVAVAAGLIRHATAVHMVHEMLPSIQAIELPSGLRSPAHQDDSARQKTWPEWMAFDGDRLVVESVQEAEARIKRMQEYMATLRLAAELAPCIVADAEYQCKRRGMREQLIAQGRALARHWTHEVINQIQCRAAQNNLNRGLAISLPYMDDEMLEMRQREFEVIPAGRIMFTPAFVWQGVRAERKKVSQDTNLSASTRSSLLAQLNLLERAFEMRCHLQPEPAEFVRAI